LVGLASGEVLSVFGPPKQIFISSAACHSSQAGMLVPRRLYRYGGGLANMGPVDSLKNGLSAVIRTEFGVCFQVDAISKRGKWYFRI
jgi:hypothetical protein